VLLHVVRMPGDLDKVLLQIVIGTRVIDGSLMFSSPSEYQALCAWSGGWRRDSRLGSRGDARGGRYAGGQARPVAVG
jgi:hypothetical protein